MTRKPFKDYLNTSILYRDDRVANTYRQLLRVINLVFTKREEGGLIIGINHRYILPGTDYKLAPGVLDPIKEELKR